MPNRSRPDQHTSAVAVHSYLCGRLPIGLADVMGYGCHLQLHLDPDPRHDSNASWPMPLSARWSSAH